MDLSDKKTVHRVALVFDPSFGSRLSDLSERVHVWIVESDLNTAAANKIWEEFKKKTVRDPLASGVTTFVQKKSDSTEKTLGNILEMIDEHHGEYSHDPPWNVLEVYGIPLAEQIEKEIREFGFGRIELLEDGFVAFVD